MRKHAAVLAAVVLAAVMVVGSSGAVLAGNMVTASEIARARAVNPEAYVGLSDAWLSSGPVETGAVPESRTMDSQSMLRDHSAPDFETGWGESAIDAGGGGE